MKRVKALSLLALVLTLGLTSVAHAEHFGPIRSAIPGGDVSLGIGYAYNSAEWEFLEIRQNQLMLEASLGLVNDWVAKLRGGAADMRISNGFRFSETRFEGDTQPFAEAYLGGPLFRGRVLSVGPFVHGSYVYTYEDIAEDAYNQNTGLSGAERVRIEDMWRATTGLTFQLEIEGASLYFGPTYAFGNLNYESLFVDTATAAKWTSGDAKPDNPLGAFAGIRWQLPTEDWPAEGSKTYLDAEVRMTGDLSAGAMLYFTF